MTAVDESPSAAGAPVVASLARAVESSIDAKVTAIDGLVRLTGGSSREIWAFVARTDDGDELDLVLRRDPVGEARDQGMLLEVAAMDAARRAGVPVPRLYGSPEDHLAAGGIVMERVGAETDPRRILGDPSLAAARAALASACGTALGNLHCADPATSPPLPRIDRLAAYRDELDRLDRARPILELAYRWLADHRPAPRPDVVVHGDFRLGNLAVGEHGLVAVFDWESAHVGDRLEDLGWIAVKSWRFRGAGTIGGFGEVEDLLDSYAAATGVRIGPDEFTWSLLLNTWIWGVGCLQQADRHLSGAQRSLDLALVGRRVVEVEADLLELLS